MGSPNQTLQKCRRFVEVSEQRVITNMGMVEIPVQRLSEEEQQILRQEAEMERIRQRRLRESQQSDQMWPRRKRSDLMAHMIPSPGSTGQSPRSPPPPLSRCSEEDVSQDSIPGQHVA